MCAEKMNLDHIKRQKSHTISLLVANKPGVLLRITLVFARRGFNIESLVVSPALDGSFSRMTIMAKGDRNTLEQIIKQVGKLVDVVSSCEHLDENAVEYELALIKVKVNKSRRSDLMLTVDHFKAETVDITQDFVIVQITSSSEKLDTFIEMMSEFEMVECVRTGKVLMVCGEDIT